MSTRAGIIFKKDSVIYDKHTDVDKGINAFYGELDFQTNDIDGSIWTYHKMELRENEILRVHLNYVGETNLDKEELNYDLDLDAGYDLILKEAK